jgi:O-methyltransferase involved in polyketide biosynthesis
VREDQASNTALGVSVIRAVHQIIDEIPHILEDPISPRLLDKPEIDRIRDEPEKH